jgi:hypothetical protein
LRAVQGSAATRVVLPKRTGTAAAQAPDPATVLAPTVEREVAKRANTDRSTKEYIQGATQSPVSRFGCRVRVNKGLPCTVALRACRYWTVFLESSLVRRATREGQSQTRSATANPTAGGLYSLLRSNERTGQNKRDPSRDSGWTHSVARPIADRAVPVHTTCDAMVHGTHATHDS